MRASPTGTRSHAGARDPRSLMSQMARVRYRLVHRATPRRPRRQICRRTEGGRRTRRPRRHSRQSFISDHRQVRQGDDGLHHSSKYPGYAQPVDARAELVYVRNAILRAHDRVHAGFMDATAEKSSPYLAIPSARGARLEARGGFAAFAAWITPLGRTCSDVCVQSGRRRTIGW